MKREDIAHLARLSRIRMADDELDNLAAELPKIVSYVSVISDIAASDMNQIPATPTLHNIFREDEVTNMTDAHTADLLREMPATEGRYMKVRKILKADTK